MERLYDVNPLISVVMPAYNAEKTIAKAIHSVLQQDYPNIELIVVNDGSSDGTEAVSRNIKDNRLITVSQNNLGLSGARNTGLSHVRGVFVVFVDSDDWIESNFISLLYDSLVKNNASLSICGMVRDYPNNVQKHIAFKKVSCFVDCFNNQDFLSLFEGGLMNSCCNKLYKKDIIERNQLSFSGKVLVEDIEFNLKYMKLSDIINIITDCPYHYVVGNGSLTCKVSEEMLQNYMGIQTIFYENLSAENKVFANRFVYHQYMSIFIKFLSNVASGDKGKKEVYPLINKYIKEPLIQQSFDSHTSNNQKEAFFNYCLKKGKFNLIVLYYRYKELFR